MFWNIKWDGFANLAVGSETAQTLQRPRVGHDVGDRGKEGVGAWLNDE